jgi:hypothetical protein
MRRNTLVDFWEKVRKGPGCWEWMKAKDGDGYGLFHWHGRMVRAARFVLEEIKGIDMTGLQTRHKCDNPSCVRPSHLLPGTSASNAKDRDSRGRGLKGRKQSKERVEKRVAARLANGKKWSSESKIRLSLKMKGRRHSKASREKMSKSRLGVKRPDLSKLLSGEGNGRAVLTTELVKLIRELRSRGRTKVSLSREFGVSYTQVGRIVSGEAWKQVKEEP